MIEKDYQGGCLCGAIRYTVSGPVDWAGYCHCDSCRQATGSAVVMHVGFGDNGFSIESGEISRFESSPGMLRGFCNQCGTPLTTENERFKDYIQVYIGTLDKPNEILPMEHVHNTEKLSWFEIDDDLPRHNGSAAENDDDWKS